MCPGVELDRASEPADLQSLRGVCAPSRTGRAAAAAVAGVGQAEEKPIKIAWRKQIARSLSGNLN